MFKLAGRHRREQRPADGIDMPPGWRILEIPSGLLVTTADGPPPDLPVEAPYFQLVVASSAYVPTIVVAALARLARSLPDDIQQRLRLAAWGETDMRPLADLAGALRLPVVRLETAPPPTPTSPPPSPTGPAPAGSLSIVDMHGWGDLPEHAPAPPPMPAPPPPMAAPPPPVAVPAPPMPVPAPPMAAPAPPVAVPPPPVPAPGHGAPAQAAEGWTIDSDGRIRLAAGAGLGASQPGQPQPYQPYQRPAQPQPASPQPALPQPPPEPPQQPSMHSQASQQSAWPPPAPEAAGGQRPAGPPPASGISTTVPDMPLGPVRSGSAAAVPPVARPATPPPASPALIDTPARSAAAPMTEERVIRPEPRQAARTAPRPTGKSLIRPADLQEVAARWRNHASSSEDRRQFRTSLGWRYDAATQYVSRLLSDRPVLRATDDEGLAADLAAVQYFTNSADHELLRNVRAAGLSAPDTPLLSCLVSGLRRLPALVGPVVRGGPADPHDLGAFQPGVELAEPGPLLALTDVGTPLRGNAEVLIWSTSARQLQGLTDPKAASAVMFLPGSTLRVLGRDGGSELAQILMVEVPAGWHGPPDPARDERITNRLRSIAAARTGMPQPPQPPELGWAMPWLAPLPGLAPVPGAAAAPAMAHHSGGAV